MSELEERINSVLKDPEQLNEITKLARSLMGGLNGDSDSSSPAPSTAEAPMMGMFDQMGLDADMLSRVSRLVGLQQGGSSGNSHALLEAMKPYLSDKRKQKMDKAMRLARLAKLAGLAFGEMEGKGND